MDLSIADLLFSGVKLMFIGMGIVFFFLLLLVGVIQQTHAITARAEAKPGRASRVKTDSSSGGEPAADADLVAVVTAAIHHYETRTPQHQGVSNG